jgi:hypothetical protein
MITRFLPIEEAKQIFYELFLNSTDAVTKIANESTLNGIAYGAAKLFQKSVAETAVVESHLFPENAFGFHLDNIAQRNGIAPRFGASGSTTFVRLVASSGTLYTAAGHSFVGDGITFELTEDVTVGDAGYTYAKVRSVATGSRTNVPSLSINTVTPVPEGHFAVFNEYHATGARDVEGDDLFKVRIRKQINLLAKDTLSYLVNVFQKFDEDILDIYNYGIDDGGNLILGVLAQNGQEYTDEELQTLLDQVAPYLSLVNYDDITGNAINVTLVNVQYRNIDISARVDISLDQPIDQTRTELQVALSKEIDFRFWKPGQKVEWDNLLEIVKSHPMIKYVSDSSFFPGNDVIIPVNKLPRIRGFILMDLNGNLLIDNNNVLNPIFYPNDIDFSFQQTVLQDA